MLPDNAFSPTDSETNLHIGTFKAHETIELSQALNGGWVIWAAEGPMLARRMLGAFSTPEDMVLALANSLAPGALIRARQKGES